MTRNVIHSLVGLGALALVLTISGCTQGSHGNRPAGQEPTLANPASPERRVAPKKRPPPGARLLVSPTVIRRLPVAPGHKVIGAPLQIEVTAQGILQNNKILAKIVDGRVVASAKKSGEQGYLITAVHEHFVRLAQRQKAAGKERLGCVLLLVDRDLTYRVVTELLYTLTQAGVGCHSVAVNPPPATELGVASLRISTPRIDRVRSGKSPAKLVRRTNEWGQVYYVLPVPSTDLQDIEIN